MKKVKIMLTAIAILTVVGGALAFKAKNHNVYCGVQGAAIGTTDCPLYLLKTFTANPAGNIFCTVTGPTCNTRATSSNDN